MWGSGVLRGIVITALLLFNHCGGRSTGPANATAGMSGIGGGPGTIDGCMDTAEDAGCGGEAAAQDLAPYARLRTSCSSRTQVMRDAGPVPIDCRIR
jgi:hypothetical protein